MNKTVNYETISVLDNTSITIDQAINKTYFLTYNKGIDYELTLDLADYANLSLIVFIKNKKGKLTIKANLSENAELQIYNVVITKQPFTLNEEVTLNKPNSKCHLQNVFLASDKAVINSKIVIDHLSQNTTSVLENYAISKNTTIINLDNNATLKKGVYQSNAYQATKGLTIDATSKIKALPTLFIDEYDVLASHATSIGTLNSEDLFYLMSRGLTKRDASQIMIMGFIQPILDNIMDEKIKHKIYQAFIKSLQE